MKSLREPLARMANKQDGCTGAFFEGRYKSIAILDEEALLSVCAYIDSNPVAAGIVALPEESPHTSIKERQGLTFGSNPVFGFRCDFNRRSATMTEDYWSLPAK